MVILSPANVEGNGSLEPVCSNANGVTAAPATRWFLESIDAENFKSYKGQVRVGPFKPFVAVIGPNGSGKSNLMDAISFVMGERTATLRVRRLNELIHGASMGNPVAAHASVTANFKELRNNNPTATSREIRFTRIIRGSSCDYVVNEEVVNQQQYFEELKKVGINAKGKNFLVFQGGVESIAMKNSKERCALLEEICGSGDLKDEYERTKTEAAAAERRIEQAYMQKKSVTSERREIKAEMQEAKQYNELLDEITVKEKELYLYRIYHNSEEIDRVYEELVRKRREVDRWNDSKAAKDAEWKEKKKESGGLTRLLNAEETVLNQCEETRRKEFPKQIEIKEKMKHLEKKLANAEKSLKQAEDNKVNNESDISTLKKNLKEVERSEKAFLNDYKELLTSQGVDVTMQESQMKEYWELKKQVCKATEKQKQQMEQLEKSKKAEGDVYASLSREKTDLEAKLDVVNHEFEEKKKFAKRTHESVEEIKAAIKTKEKEIAPLQNEVASAEERIDKLNEELEKLTLELQTFKTNKHEASRIQRKLQAIVALQQHFKGVKDRVSFLVKIRHPRHKIALTKVIGRNMDAIVVDTEKTARDCIQYLKEQMMDEETFLPLDLLEVQQLRTRLRNENENIFLAYDLLQFSPELEKAVLYCVRSTVVCRDPALASRIASGEVFGEGADAVSLDGTRYSASGMISGGKADLERMAGRWDESAVSQKEETKSRIQKQVREANKSVRKRMQLEILQTELEGLNNKLKYAQQELEKLLKSSKEIDQAKARLPKDLQSLAARWTKAEEKTSGFCTQLRDVRKSINEIEDKVFRQFCKQIKIPNIRAYEESDLRAQDEFNNKRDDFRQKIQKMDLNIKNCEDQLSNSNQNVQRWTGVVSGLRKDLQLCVEERTKIESEMTKIDKKLAAIQKKIGEMKEAVDVQNKGISAAHKLLVIADKSMLQAQKEVTRLQNLLQQRKAKRHDLYIHCKLKGIDIPLRRGSWDSIRIGETGLIESDVSPPSSDRDDGEQQTCEKVDRLEVNFDDLPRKLKQIVGPGIQLAEEEMEEEIRELEAKTARILAPNMKADQRLEAVMNKWREQQEEFEKIRQEGNIAKEVFEKVKKKRHEKFMKCYDRISKNIESIYKALTRSVSAQAVLELDNPEEPYLSGISYCCVAPGKRFQPMKNLSGGEKTLAALALLFAIQSYEPAPFFVLDEIDAALDSTNIGKVTSYIKQSTKNFQILVISLKEEFYENADLLVGIAPDIQEQEAECVVSKLYTLDLSEYNDHNPI